MTIAVNTEASLMFYRAALLALPSEESVSSGSEVSLPCPTASGRGGDLGDRLRSLR
jgi:hypothetical protein